MSLGRERQREIQSVFADSINYGTPMAEALVTECALIGHVFAYTGNTQTGIIRAPRTCIFCGFLSDQQ